MLTEIKKDESRSGYSIYRCVCGSEKSIRRNAVKSGSTKSCGCHRKKQAVKNGKMATTHGMSNTDVYRYWIEYKHENEIPAKWEKFEDFYSEIGFQYKKGTQIVYKDNKYMFVESSESKNIKRKETCLKKYGVQHPSMSINIQERIKNTVRNKYGVDYVLQSEKIKNKIKNTCLEKYGATSFRASDAGRRTFSKKYIVHDGKTTKQLAEEIGISSSYFNILVREQGLDYALNFQKKSRTRIEQVIYDILTSYDVEFKEQYKIENRFADFYIPNKNVIIEADGNYWHSDAVNEDKFYHRDKRNLYLKYKIHPLFFREDEIINKPEVVESIIINKLQLNCRSIYARKCKIVEVKDKKTFFNENHLMGVGRGRCIGLSYGDELVAAIQFTNRSGLIDISRFCTKMKTSVVGGFSKLLKQVLKENFSSIVNFVDCRYGDGSHLSQFGFNLKNCDVSFSWVKDLNRVHRMKFRSNSGYEYGYNKIWDCGQAKWVFSV